MLDTEATFIDIAVYYLFAQVARCKAPSVCSDAMYDVANLRAGRLLAHVVHCFKEDM